jgi:hypothetical protein
MPTEAEVETNSEAAAQTFRNSGFVGFVNKKRGPGMRQPSLRSLPLTPLFKKGLQFCDYLEIS